MNYRQQSQYLVLPPHLFLKNAQQIIGLLVRIYHDAEFDIVVIVIPKMRHLRATAENAF